MDYYSEDQLADMAELEQYHAEQRDAAIAAMEATGYTDAAELAAADRIDPAAFLRETCGE